MVSIDNMRGRAVLNVYRRGSCKSKAHAHVMVLQSKSNDELTGLEGGSVGMGFGGLPTVSYLSSADLARLLSMT